VREVLQITLLLLNIISFWTIIVSHDLKRSMLATAAVQSDSQMKSWLHLGLIIEQKQFVISLCFCSSSFHFLFPRYHLLNHTRKTQTTHQTSSKLFKLRKELQAQLVSFHANLPFVLDDSLPPISTSTIPSDNVDDGSDDSDCNSDHSASEEHSDDEGAPISPNPEKAFLPLPSHLGQQHFNNPVIAALVAEELHLRVDQASHALQQLRLSLGLKSALFRNSVALANSQKTKTRAWRSVKVVDASVRRHTQEYRIARQALMHLHALPSLMGKFPILRKEDLKMSRDIVEENRVGQRSDHVSWIWRVDNGQIIYQHTWLKESECLDLSVSAYISLPVYPSVQRVNWLRAKARNQRWEEEITIVTNEMCWTQLWFQNQVDVWEERRRVALLHSSQGHQVYAAKQVWVWIQFLEDAKKAFIDLVPTRNL
jgi:hypothetical protein